MDFSAAERLAARLLPELRPLCSRIEVTGDLRRRAARVERPAFCAETTDPDALALRCGRQAKVWGRTPTHFLTELQNGVSFAVWLSRPAGDDLYQPTPANFGAVLLATTGPDGFTTRLRERAQRLGLWLGPDGLTRAGAWVAGTEEADIFQALNLPLVPPEERDAWRPPPI